MNVIDTSASSSSPDMLEARALPPASPPPAPPVGVGRGSVVLDSDTLRQLRQAKLLSQQDLADDCWRRNIQVSLATIKRAELGRAVRYRIARELARYFDVPVMMFLR